MATPSCPSHSGTQPLAQPIGHHMLYAYQCHFMHLRTGTIVLFNSVIYVFMCVVWGELTTHVCKCVRTRVCEHTCMCVCVSILSSLFPKRTVPFAALMCPLAFLTSLHVLFLFQVTLHTRHSVRSACNACTLSQSVQRKRTVQASLGGPAVPKSWRGQW